MNILAILITLEKWRSFIECYSSLITYKQTVGYINELVPKDIETHIFEATSDYSWLSLFPHAKMHIINTFGSSGKGDEVYEKYGFSGDKLMTFFDKYLK